MIPGDERDDLDLGGIEPAQVAVLDEVIRVLVMAFVADMDADVMQERAVLEPLPLPVAESVVALGRVEERERQPRDSPRVIGQVVEPLGQLGSHCAAARPGSARPCGCAPGSSDTEHQAPAKREVAEGQFFGAEQLEQGIDEDRAGDRQVRAARIEARHLEPLGKRPPEKLLAAASGSAC
jgi:hypothetical protein